ncbi:MAG TPA: branched-chain-amino-acid transaminase [Methanocella sp.]|nr:branched-chain-amino-acid transaminase [Methanocella sp.]
MTEYIYIDGRFYDKENAKISVFDHGLLYGDGVFEGIRAYNGRVFRLDEHIDRMYDGARAIMLQPALSKDEIKQAILETVRKNNLKDAYIRPIITRGVGSMGLDPRKCPKSSIIIIAESWGAMYGSLYEIGLTGVSVSVRRNAAEALPTNIKSLNYLNNILAKIEANEKGGDEAIIFDVRGNVSEGSGDNIFIIKNGKIFTPFVQYNLSGITRMCVFELCAKQRIPIIEQNLGYFDMYTADEVFVTGTAAEIAPMTKIDGRIIGDGRPGPVTKKLMKAYSELTRTTGTPIY